MLTLIKYEFVRKSKLLLILLVTEIVVNIGLCLAFGMGGGIAFFVFNLIVLPILYLYELIRTYSDDINRKSGYMLFMTPNSGYKIIGSKLVVILLEGLLIFLTYILFAIVNLAIFSLITVGNFSAIVSVFNSFIYNFNTAVSLSLGYTAGDIFLLIIIILISLIVFVLTIYSAMTIRKSIFANIKFGGLFSFIIFLILNYVYTKLSNIVSTAFQFNVFTEKVMSNMTITYPTASMIEMFVVSLIFNSIISLGLVGLSGYLLEKRINL